jgi:hypothetical protein
MFGARRRFVPSHALPNIDVYAKITIIWG